MWLAAPDSNGKFVILLTGNHRGSKWQTQVPSGQLLLSSLPLLHQGMKEISVPLSLMCVKDRHGES